MHLKRCFIQILSYFLTNAFQANFKKYILLIFVYIKQHFIKTIRKQLNYKLP